MYQSELTAFTTWTDDNILVAARQLQYWTATCDNWQQNEFESNK